jgi:FKBP-type peptidyl-prolyl cis-trans isomerase
MKEGGKRELTIPPDLGFGASNVNANGVVVPPNSERRLEVELVKVK